MMLTYRFVRLIEDRSDALASGLLHKVQRSSRTEAYHKVPPEELKQRVYEIYRHLGEWLLDKSEADIEQRYTEIGTRRAHQGVPLSQLIWAIVLTKDNLWEFILNESYSRPPGRDLWKTGTACSCSTSSLIGRFTLPLWATSGRSEKRVSQQKTMTQQSRIAR